MIGTPYGRVFAMINALLLIGFFFSNTARADAGSDAIAASVNTAQSWLPGIDGGNYADSYAGFCVLAKTSLGQDAWVKALKQVRDPLGALTSRTLKNKQYLTALPNGTQGQFVILQYETDFANFNATETVTTMLDKDGQWRIAGYFIKPRS